jgi:hypothetical protein
MALFVATENSSCTVYFKLQISTLKKAMTTYSPVIHASYPGGLHGTKF